MADNRFMNTAAADASQIDVGLRSYMLGVYNHMTIALLFSGLFAFGTKMLTTVTGPDGGLYLTSLGQLIYASPLKWVVMLAPLGMVFWLSARMNSMSASRARTMFYVYSALMGLSLSSILLTFSMPSVARAFFVTAGAFAALSLYGYTTAEPVCAWIILDDWAVWSDHCQRCEHFHCINSHAFHDLCWWCPDICWLSV